MNDFSHDKQILRELGKRKYEIGSLSVQQEIVSLWKRLNSLEHVRPLVLITEIPWHEIATKRHELVPQCRDRFLAQIEIGLRRELYQWDHFACDMVVEPVIYSQVVCDPTSCYADYGLEPQLIRMPDAKDVLYEPLIKSLDDIEKIKSPKVWVDVDLTLKRQNLLDEIFDGVIPVETRGIVHQWHTPWDVAVRWYGVERLLFDMYDNPELVKGVVKRLCDLTGDVLDLQEADGLLDVGTGNWMTGSGGLGFTDELPNRRGMSNVTPKDQWGCGNAQVFSEVSPEFHEEFSLRYERPILERFGLTYYGCCEPSHHKIDMLKSIKNLRKISMSPQANLNIAAEHVTDEFVLSVKPNPAYLAYDVFKPDQVIAV